MNNVWAVLFLLGTVLNVIEAITISVTGEGNSVSIQVTDQIIIAIFFATIAIREFRRGRK